MKKLTVAILISLVLCFATSVISNAGEVGVMTDKLIRLHVIANSDSEGDQNLKLKVRDGILETVEEIVADCTDKAEAMAKISENLSVIESAAEDVVRKNGYDLGVECTLDVEEFDRRVYDDFTLPAGEYDSLCVRIGEAKGHNWWCVCYPALCFGASVSIEDCDVFTEDELIIVRQPEEVRYKLWCFELVRKIKNIFK